MTSILFGELFEFIRNGMNVSQDKSGRGLPITRIETISTGHVDPLRVGYADLDESDCNGWLLQPGDILMSHINSVEHLGKTAVYDGTPEKIVHGMNLLCLRPDTLKITPRYAHYVTKSPAFRTQFAKSVKKAVNQASVSISDLRSIKINIPSLDEQKRIAAILDAADALRAKRRAALAKLDQLAQSIFIEMFGDPALNTKQWPLRRLGDLATKFSDGPFGSNLMSKHYRDQGVRVIRLQNIGVGELVDQDRAFISEDHFRTLSKHECRPGDILVGTLGEPNLRACILPDHIPIAINKADCVQVRADTSVATPQYLCALLNCPSTERMAHDLIHGQTRARISMGRLRELRVPAPNIKFQQEFSAVIESVNAEKSQLVSSTNIIDQLMSSLQYRAFTGEL